MPPTKLNIFQRGILQKAVSVAVYFISFVAVAFIVDWLEKRRFTVVVEKAKQQGILTAENFRDLKALIAAMDESAIFAIIVVVVLCGGIGWLLMRLAANFNWSWPTTLPKAIEFRAAMRRLNVTDLAGEIECVRRHKLSVFIALSPLRKDEESGRGFPYRSFCTALHVYFQKGWK
jgi:preprotein translocase subunit SecY